MINLTIFKKGSALFAFALFVTVAGFAQTQNFTGPVSIGTGSSQLTFYPGQYNPGVNGLLSDVNSFAIDLPGTKRITFSDNIHLTDGNMGIGTLNAWDKLQIKGGLRVGSEAESDYLRFTHTLTAGLIEAFEDDDGLFFRSNKAKLFTFNGLTVDIKPLVLSGGMSSQLSFIDPDGGTSPMSIKFKDDASPDLSIMGGRLGVNTVDPTETLDVTGNIKGQTLKIDKIALSSSSTNTTYGYNSGAALTASNNGNVALGRGAAGGLNNANYSVFIGYNAGTDFSQVSYEGQVNPLTAGKSVFVVNNQAQLHNPLLFGTFVGNTNKDDANHHTVNGSMAQLAINTVHLVDSAALTVAGAVHIGPKNLHPATFPHDSLYRHYLLYVERGVLSENYAFGSVERWSDFVFDENYKLTPLSEVEKFVQKNNHLPLIPSDAEVKKNGYDQHTMNTLFLQKIEELTLYAIELEKKVEDYKKLEERLKKLESILK